MQSLLLLIAPAPGYMRRDALHEKHQLRPFHRTEADAMTKEYTGMETAKLQTLVINDIAAVLPMKQFHHLAAFAYKYIYVTICRVQTYAAYFAA